MGSRIDHTELHDFIDQKKQRPTNMTHRRQRTDQHSSEPHITPRQNATLEAASISLIIYIMLSNDTQKRARLNNQAPPLHVSFNQLLLVQSLQFGIQPFRISITAQTKIDFL